ncbi:MAG TPA: hypothetical protein VEB86_19730, partial [Chryseosolibacter sp.]|nr:hypothetical protein [Chryseosolibacter sp.]
AESGAGAMLAASDIPGIIDFVLRSYMSWKNHVVPRANGGHRQYSRKNLTARLVELLDKNS